MANNNHNTRNTSFVNPTFTGACFLGICILIAGIIIGANVRKLTTTIEDKSFSSVNSYNAPSSVSVGEKKYLNETEAAEYLNMSVQEITNLITSGEISEYVKTSTGYSVSVSVLDEWFDNEAYQNKLNAAEIGSAS